jgi:preprotein translocase subunit SecE
VNPFRSLSIYLVGVVTELRKVVWPTLPTLATYFVSVVVGLALATTLVGAVDYLFIKGLTHIIK